MTNSLGDLEWHPEASRPEEGLATMKYAVVYEKAPHNYSAYVPDLAGCVATGATRKDVERSIREAIAFHLEGMRIEGLPIPKASAWAETVEVAA